VQRESNLIIVQQDATVFSLLYFCRQLYMFRVLTPRPLPEAVITVVRASDDGCQHPKRVELPTEIQ
jgi:hypothetical protein